MKPKTAKPSSAGAVRPSGRPRSAEVDEAILTAAVELLTSVGPDATTISGVVRRSGIGRASVYLRYPTRDALVAAAVQRVIGRTPSPLPGDIEAALKTGADQTRAMIDSPEFQTLLPMIVRGLLRPDGHPGTLAYDSVVPNRLLVAQTYKKVAAAGGFRTDVDPELVIDLLIGGLLSQLLAKGSAPSPAATRRMVNVIVEGVRARTPVETASSRPGTIPRGRASGSKARRK